MPSEVTVNFRAPKELRDAFQRAAAAQDQTASQVLRRLMADFVRQNGQASLFDLGATKKGS